MAIFLLWLLCAILGAALLSRYNKAGTGFILGAMLGPLGLLFALVMRSGEGKKEAQTRHNEQLRAINKPQIKTKALRSERECPYCAEKILVKAKFCKHCKQNIDDPLLEKEAIKKQNSSPTNNLEIPNLRRNFEYIEPYPFSFNYQGQKVSHNNKTFIVKNIEFSSADEAKKYIDKK